MTNQKIPKEILKINNMFKSNGFALHLVGGCVRDMLLGEVPHDYDMCTDAKPDDMIRMCKENGLKYADIGIAHGTISIIMNNEWYEITTYRIDGEYSDNRHPDQVSFTNSLEEDLSRRDFTINAMAMTPDTKELIDPFGGRIALFDKKLIAVGDADKRIEEDALRMLRAIRFAIRYELSVDEKLKRAIHENVYQINYVSKERITDEFRKLFSYGKPVFEFFKEFRDLIEILIPDISPCVGFWQNNKYHKHNVYGHMLAVVDLCKTTKFEIKMAALLHDIGKPKAYDTDEEGNGHFYGHPKISKEICEKLLKQYFRLTADEKERILLLVEHHDMEIAETKKSVKRVLNKYGEDFMRDWLILKQADMDDHVYPNDKMLHTVSGIETIMNDIIESSAAFSLKDLAVNGNDLMCELNIKPGKEVGMILNRLLSDVMDEALENNKHQLLKRAKELYAAT